MALTDKQLLRVSLICLIGVIGVSVLAFCTGCASSRVGTVLNVGVGISGAADLFTTRQAIDQGRGYERSPLMGQGVVQQAVMKSLGIGGVIGLAWISEQKGHHVLAHVIRSAAIGVWSAAAISNHQIGR